jgi:hypothetical protein
LTQRQLPSRGEKRCRPWERRIEKKGAAPSSGAPRDGPREAERFTSSGSGCFRRR